MTSVEMIGVPGRERIGGFRANVAGATAVAVAMAPLLRPFRAVRLILPDALAPYFFINGASLNGSDIVPFVADGGVPGLGFKASNNGGPFHLPSARAGDVLAVRVTNLNIGMLVFHAAIVGYDPDVTP